MRQLVNNSHAYHPYRTLLSVRGALLSRKRPHDILGWHRDKETAKQRSESGCEPTDLMASALKYARRRVIGLCRTTPPVCVRRNRRPCAGLARVGLGGAAPRLAGAAAAGPRAFPGGAARMIPGIPNCDFFEYVQYVSEVGSAFNGTGSGLGRT